MKRKEKKYKKSCPDKKMFFLVSSNEVNMEKKEEFIDHILICKKCRKKFEIMNQLSGELEGKISPIPDESLSQQEHRQLRKLARQKIGVLGISKGKKLIFGFFPIPYFAAAATILTAILVFLLIPMIQHKGELRRGTPGKLVLIEPLGKIKHPPSVFSWSPVKGADGYEFKLIDENLDTLFYEDGITKVQIVIPEKLRNSLIKDKIYIWEVVAYDDAVYKLDSSSNSFSIK
ncbi:hypothetical protein ACFLQZ_02150 [Acidobacteriota bacterium]